MTLRGTLRILVSKWQVVIAGALLSTMLAGVVYSLVPAQYTSEGVGVLVQPRRTSINSNPLLNFDASLSTTALMIVQDLNTPQAGTQLGVRSGVESYTIEQASTDASFASGPVVQPFISVKTKASTAQRSTELVDGLFDLARQDLVDQQKELRVLPQNYIRLQSLGYTSAPKRVISTLVAATGAAFLIGLCLTFALVLLLDRRERRRTTSRSASSKASRRGPDPHLAFGTEEFVGDADADGIASANGTHGPVSRVHG